MTRRTLPVNSHKTGRWGEDARPILESLKDAGNPLWISGLFCLPGNASQLDIGSNTGVTLRGLDPSSILCIEQYEPAVRQLRNQSFQVLQGDALEISHSLVREGRLFDRVTLFDLIEHLDRTQGERLLGNVERLAIRQVLLFVPLETDELVATDEYRAFMAKMFNAIPHDQHSLQQHRSRWSPDDFKKRDYEILILNDFHMKGFSAFFAVKHKFKSDHELVTARIRRFLGEMNREPVNSATRGQRMGKAVTPAADAASIQFGHKGSASRVLNPALIFNPDRIFIGDRVFIQTGARLEAIKEYQGITHCPSLVIEDGVTIELDVHIGAANRVRIGKSVMIAGRVTILDHDHGYEDPMIPPVRQPLKVGVIDIDDHAWIGENACVCKNVHIGKHAVVGANSVVTGDVPSFSVAVGNPARVIKAYDFPTGEWRKVSEEALADFLVRRREHAEILYQRSLKAASVRQYDEAVGLLNQLLNFCPNHAPAHHHLGAMCYRKGDLLGALHHYETSVGLAPGLLEARKSLAELYFTAFDRVEDALEIYRRIASEYPDDSEAVDRAKFIQKRRARLDGRHAPGGVRKETRPETMETMDSETGLTMVGSGKEEIVRDMTSIVILAYNELKYTRECVESIRRHTPDLHEIVFVDNGSSDGTVKWLRKIVAENTNYQLIANAENHGFAKGCNQGIRASRGEFILLLNNDVVVTEGWLSGMLEPLRRSSAVGIVGPMTNNISGIQRVPSVEYKRIEEMHQFARNFRLRNRHRQIVAPRIVGFCMLFRRELVEKVGLLDEGFGSGNFEDDDFCLRAALNGFSNLIVGDVFIHHYGSRTFIGNRIDHSRAMARNRRLFSEKWNSPDSGEKRLQLHLMNVMNQARHFHHSDRTDKAIDLLLEGLKFSSTRPELYMALTEILIEAKQPEKALEVLAQAPASLSDVRMLEFMCTCKESLNCIEEAEALAERLLDSNPASAFAMNMKGMIAYKKGEKHLARECFERAIACDPSIGEPHTNLGVMRWAEGHHKQALELLERGFILSPTPMDIATSYLSAATELQEFTRAETSVREAIALHPANKRLRAMSIEVLLHQGKYSEAVDAIEDMIVHYGHDEGLIEAALAVREKLSPSDRSDQKHKRRTLSVCMIVKNEEESLARCLNNVKPVADELIVVDTGSEDRTKDIAAIFGAKVYDFKWTGDFSEARNFSLSKASCDWILVLDADEIISSRDHERLARIVGKKGQRHAYLFTTRNYVESATTAGWRVNEGEYPEEEKRGGWVPSTKVRLFPNDRRIVFHHKVHELVEPSLKRLGIEIKPSEIPVHHYGKLNLQRVTEKEEAYYELGVQKRERNKDDVKALLELAIAANEAGRHQEAVSLWEELIRLKPCDAPAHFGLGAALLKCGDFREAMRASKTAFSLDDSLKEAVFNYAVCALCTGEDLENAMASLERLLERDPDYPPALGMLGTLLIVTNRAEEGLARLDRFKQMGFSISDCFYQNAKRLIDTDQTMAAIRLMETAIETENADQNITLLLARTYLDTSAFSEAKTQSPPCH